MENEIILTEPELRTYDGLRKPMLVAYHGDIYDVSQCPHWKQGMHEGIHFPGQDLSKELVDAPHREEVFSRPCVKRVGRLAEFDE